MSRSSLYYQLNSRGYKSIILPHERPYRSPEQERTYRLLALKQLSYDFSPILDKHSLIKQEVLYGNRLGGLDLKVYSSRKQAAE